MEVTRLNFKEALPVISEAIEDASFLAIDAEFSGLTVKKKSNSLDTCEERYHKLIYGIKDFTILQFGISTFSWDEEQQQYVAKPFNFYIFPKPYNRQMPDMKFLCQSSSMDFLASQGFDFNKWIYHGIPFLLPYDEDKLRRLMETRREEDLNEQNSTTTTPKTKKGKYQSITIPPEFEKTIENIMKKIAEFIEDPNEKTLSLPPSTPFVRKLVYGSVKSTYKSGLHLESKVIEKDKKHIVISKVTEDEKKYLENEKSNREDNEIELAIGFSKVIRMISQSGKIILGHNMLLDLLHMIRLFSCPLPGDLDGFKALVRGIFPRLVDTKLMASTKPLQDHFPLTHLEEVYKKSSEEPFQKPNVLLAEGFEQYLESSKAHEAGFDAYITGVSFLAMVSYLQKLRDGAVSETEIDFEVTKPFLNKIFLFPRIEDIPYLNLSGSDLTPNRDHVFYVEFPETWQFSDIQSLFKDFGYVYISRLNSTSAFVSVAKRERATKVLYKLDIDDVPYRIMSYNEYHNGSTEDDEDGAGGSDYPQNKSHDVSPTPSPRVSPSPKPARASRELTKEVTPLDDEVEEGELPDSPEASNSAEPPRKKPKNQQDFEEPDEW